jgi:hypothetical protein
LARRLGLVDVGPLRQRESPPQCKIVVFVPEADLGGVSDALFSAGAGNIGHYSQCSFRLSGQGTFFGSEATNPAVGQKGRREEVDEWRLEVICPTEKVADAVAAMRKAHSYEEPAFDVYSLRPGVSEIGEGRLGRLPDLVPLDAFAHRVRAALKIDKVQINGNSDKPVNRVAVACGAAGEFLGDALKNHADVLVTGEMRFHDCLAAEAQGIALVLAGHFATERFGLEELAERLQTAFPELTVCASCAERDPLRWVE